MWLYIKQLIQLLLSPARGWEDISEAAMSSEDIQRRGFYPWLGIVGASDFLRLFYVRELTFLAALQSAIAIAGALFISLYLARLFLDLALPQYVDNKLNVTKINTFTIFMTGMIGFYNVISNAMPASMTFLHFLPLLSLLIIFKSTVYMGIMQDKAMTFLWITAVGVILIPIGMATLLSFII